jgi:hypothetical protein
MHRAIPVSLLATTGLGLALSPMLGGCLADTGDGAILVLKNIHPDTTCVGMGLDTEPALSSGRIDTVIPSSYVFFAQMKSRITALAGQEDQRTIIVTDAKVDITFPGSTVFSAAELTQFKTDGLTHFKVPFSQVITPGGTSDAAFNLIPIGLVKEVAKKATTTGFSVDSLATFTIEGQMAGSTVSSQTFTYPVTIGSNQVISVLGACPLPKGTATPHTGYACNPFQDGIVECCTSGPTTLTCPATVTQ